MNTVTIDVRTLEDSLADFADDWKSGESSGPRISFASHELLWKTLTLKRWAIIKAMTGVGAMSIREIARRVNRDIKAVHGDVKALLEVGLLDKTENGQVVFPYDSVHVDFLMKAA